MHELLPASQAYPSDYKKKVLDLMIDRFVFVTDVANFGYFFSEPDYFGEESTKDLKKIFGGDARLTQI